MKRFLFVWAVVFFLACGSAFCQDAKVVTEDVQKIEKSRMIDFTIKLGTATYINHLDAETKQIAAPTPIVFSPAIGVFFPFTNLLALEPAISFYSFYYQWANGKAIPAEIENRTATTLSFFIDIPVLFNLHLQKSNIQLGIGPAALLRFGFLAGGVAESDYGFSGNAADDVKLINSFFWDKARFLYISTSASWLFNFYKNTKGGPYVSAFIPIGSLIAGEGINGMNVSIGLKVSF